MHSCYKTWNRYQSIYHVFFFHKQTTAKKKPTMQCTANACNKWKPCRNSGMRETREPSHDASRRESKCIPSHVVFVNGAYITNKYNPNPRCSMDKCLLSLSCQSTVCRCNQVKLQKKLERVKSFKLSGMPKQLMFIVHTNKRSSIPFFHMCQKSANNLKQISKATKNWKLER